MISRQIIISLNEPLRSEDIAYKLHGKIGHATVYRVLKKLKGLGFIVESDSIKSGWQLGDHWKGLRDLIAP